VAPPADSFAFARAEAILLDGANSVSGQPRAQFPARVGSSTLAVVVLVLALAWLRRRRPAWLLPALALLAAVPGAVCVSALRGDAPLRRSDTAAALVATLSTLQREAPWPGTPVAIDHEDDDVLFPLGRYAWPSRPPVERPAVRLELRGGALNVACVRDASHAQVVCGASP
jgi:hypothetical protein